MNKKLYLFILLIAADQLSKYFVLRHAVLISYLHTICNPNIAFSLSVSPLLLYPLWTVVLFSLVYLFAKSKNRLEKISLLLILSGALSNLIDRLTHGCVVDFIDLKLWPVFNLADVYITAGIILLIIYLYKNKSRKATHEF